MDSDQESAVLAWGRMLRTHRLLVERVEAELKAAGLPPPGWYDVLVELRGAHEGVRQYELCARVLLAKHNLSRLLDRLEQRGLIERRPCADDARGSLIVLSDSGAALLRSMWPVYRQAIAEHFAAPLAGAEVRELGRILGRFLPEGEG